MGKTYQPPFEEKQRRWVSKQKVFFVASAPLSPSNRVNVSPKSAAEFRFVDDSTVGYVDLTGSGSETAAHIMETSRITIMFVAFEGAPKIMRFYGRAEFVTPEEIFHDPRRAHLRDIWGLDSTDEWDAMVTARSIILLHVDRYSDSCGYSIPIYNYVKERTTLTDASTGQDLDAYRSKANAFSIDGLKSFAQVLYDDIPPKRMEENGLYIGPEDWKGAAPGVISRVLGRMRVRLLMLWASGLNGRQRDAVFFMLGCFFVHAARRSLARISA
ncbi:Pyridoxamine 5'-phosphate oxidase family protein ustO [Hondaea fermentalgiana]|uniref:Pyridoxamine 5'-phosphate oxidase family protein ustO n=1 Tax=Hondaea fermentalgiana TaxID=2315210 RepID=A0A2R5GQR6_9STRA|nr:Pyridoxamine 5'-phosphate oxidase family protein ustO [Hondaea fermentalgiana]|eukprot:GBG33222.1 Pyridoxamine 5'-phosphate oxidase family protein ustO [Hondaea fermentalgiana]